MQETSNQDRFFSDKWLWLILALAFALRLYLALSTVYVWDEERDWLRLATEISFDPDTFYTPLRGDHHSAFAAYFLKIGTYIFGENQLGFRLINLVFGTATVWVVYWLSLEWTGDRIAARWSALLLSVNEYHIGASMFALEKSLHLFFAAVSIALFARFLIAERSRLLFYSAAFAAFAFLCKEIAILLGPIYFFVLLFPKYRHWLRRSEPYCAAAVFALLISPDVMASYMAYDGSQYGTNLFDRFSQFSLGITVQPLVFYFRSAIVWINELIGGSFFDTAGFPTMNQAAGLILFVGVIAASWRRNDDDHILTLLKSVFWGIFLFFLLMPSDTPSRIEIGTAVFYWVNLTLFPAVLLVGYSVSRLSGKSLILWKGLIGLTAIYAIRSVLIMRLGVPFVSVAYSPEFIGPPDGRMVEINASFNTCMICQKDPRITLDEIFLVDDSTDIDRHVSETGDVEGAEFGTDDRSFSLRAHAGDGKFRYRIVYRVSFSSGRSLIVKDQPFGSVGVFVLKEAGEPYRRPIWVR